MRSGRCGPTDGAVDTLLARQGVCRDYAHLVIALLRGLDVPARMAAAYAPGLAPMDFHAVAEAAVDGHWRVVDATLLAPRATLVRIASGRDAADTAFLSAYGGAADLLETSVTATVDGDLPGDERQDTDTAILAGQEIDHEAVLGDADRLAGSHRANEGVGQFHARGIAEGVENPRE